MSVHGGGDLVPGGAGPGGGAWSRCGGGGFAWCLVPRTATVAGGTHPTGTHSCFFLYVCSGCNFWTIWTLNLHIHVEKKPVSKKSKVLSPKTGVSDPKRSNYALQILKNKCQGEVWLPRYYKIRILAYLLIDLFSVIHKHRDISVFSIMLKTFRTSICAPPPQTEILDPPAWQISKSVWNGVNRTLTGPAQRGNDSVFTAVYGLPIWVDAVLDRALILQL